MKSHSANNSVERDRLQAALAGSLRGFAASAAPHVKRWASLSVERIKSHFKPIVHLTSLEIK